jgi:UDP-N-acetyl-D-galactosamine dehydrogenase
MTNSINKQNLLSQIADHTVTIGIVGLGYVGLPLAVEFGKQYKVVGFDINKKRIDELMRGEDRTLEVSTEELKEAEKLSFSFEIEDLKQVDVFIVTVPTPIDDFKRPDLTPLIKASETVGKALHVGNVVVYESTVYPGCTEEDCVPVLEKFSGLKFEEDFYCGYSPERINPGDKEHRVSTIKKIVSGSNPDIANGLNELYKSIITAGTHLAPSIKVAEAAKVIENAQRDINIAFVNELSKLFNIMNIDTIEVLEAAGTKWNFLPFRPGLVGGHCIGVDPYYLTHKASQLGYHSEIILAGRRINDSMGEYVAKEFVKLLIHNDKKVFNSKVLVLGITFKENCPDIRNSRVIDIISELNQFSCKVDVYDPWADIEEVKEEYNIDLLASLETSDLQNYEGIVLAVGHKKFLSMNLEANSNLVYDVKGILNKEKVSARL